MKKRGILGIDESNHGRFPDIFVGAYSNDPLDALMNLSLHKKRKNKEITSLLKGKDFRYLCMTKDYREYFEARDMRLIALSSLIKFYHKDLESTISVIADGEIRSSDMEKLEKIYYPSLPPEIQVIPKADVTYPIVNLADQIANLLHKDYSHFKRFG